MSRPPSLCPTRSGDSIDLRSITRGFRLLNWLSGRWKNPWIDRWPGRVALRVARALGMRINAAWPGPIWSNTRVGAPLLSWFVAPVSSASPEAFVEALNAALERHPEAGTGADVHRLMQRTLNAHATGARHQIPQCPPALLEFPVAPRVLLLDERIRSRGMGAVAIKNRRDAFERMIAVARAAHPRAEFWLAGSGDTGTGNWLSSMAKALPPGVRRAGRHDSLCAMLKHVDHVYTIGASEGMHALLARVPVHVFGAPYYAGWGLTNDDRRLPGRNSRPTVAALFEIAFLRLAHYLNPATHELGDLDDLLDSIELQETVHRRFADLKRVTGVRFQLWKRPFATPFLTAGGGALRWTNKTESVAPDECAAIWGARGADELPPLIRHVRIEDGFLHSTGLGSDMIAPRSQVIDRRGLYFDAGRPSDLSFLLNETVFSEAELARAAALREQVVRLGVTKYTLGRRRPAWTAAAGKRVVLVPGQVADDASIRLGTRAIATADALLREVRERRPDAFIVYKPHPDVLSGNRSGLIDAQRLADVVDADADLLSLVDAADEVHTLSSLAGFDALLRGKAVFTYGLPFYAGWGLTHDALAPVPWRQRDLTLDMLTAGVLLRYPIYWDWRMRLFTTPEAVVRQLAPLAARPLRQVRGDRSRPFLKWARWSRNALHHVLWRSQQRNKQSTTTRDS
jgi:capsular polysaccharide export protein